MTSRHSSFNQVGALPADFSTAAERSSPSVVFIKTVSNYGRQSDYWDFWDFYGRRGPISSAGSGVIISEDGYIVTNNHVVENADKIEVILQNKHSYKAEIVGSDPNTDLALLKVEAGNLPAIQFANSDDVNIGSWALAVGNPLNLTSTVTAGIISAKGRNINIVNSQFPIESFIQTDAAINPGNSGGALVNTSGQLIGVNTAIASKTGAYSGYGFAIPSNIVRKVADDIIEYGEVQIAFLGAEVVDIDNSLKDRIPDDDYSGVYVYDIARESAALRAGFEEGDIILEVEGRPVNSKAEYMERLSYFRPGDLVKVKIKRDGAIKELKAVLTNKEGTTKVLRDDSVFSSALGAKVDPLSKVERNKYEIESGFRLSDVRSGRIRRLGLPDGFIIISVNKQVPRSVRELEELLAQARGRVIIDGVHPNGSRSYYSFYVY